MSVTRMRYGVMITVITMSVYSLLSGARADDAAHGENERLDAAVEKMMRESFTGATPEQWNERLAQEEVEKLCSRYRNQPPPSVAQRILELSGKEYRYPASGELLGNWKNGEKLASSGKGGHIGTIQPDPPGRERGANCYACHALAPTELSAGNLGPSLTGYGDLHGTSPEIVKRVYRKIYDAQAFYPCSQMPRFGHNDWLTPEEVADAVAFLLDPESSVNQ